jgi:hypothetical protein
MYMEGLWKFCVNYVRKVRHSVQNVLRVQQRET